MSQRATGVDLGLNRRHLLVTGAGGLGRVLAGEALDLGMRVTVVDRDRAALDLLGLERAGGPSELELVEADLTDIDRFDEIVESAVARFGPIDGFVPTAAVIRRQHELTEIDEEDWDFQVNVNQKAVYFLTRAVAERMKARGRGAIVLVSSAAGITGGVAGTTVYGSAKAAVLATMHGFARIYGASGVRINAVVPGSIDTPMLWVGQRPEAAATVADFAVLGRIGEPVEIAKPILFLLSDWASYVAGTTLDVDGGWLFR